MIRETGESKKVCPRCHNEYPEADNYCGEDGTRLAAINSNDLSPEAIRERDVAPGPHRAAGRRQDH